jgi:hypothetical protein
VETINSANQPDLSWPGSSSPARLGADSVRDAGFPGTLVPVPARDAGASGAFAALSTGPSHVVVRAVPRVRGKVAVATSPTRHVIPALGDQTNTHNYMTGATANAGEGASGPPPHREPV